MTKEMIALIISISSIMTASLSLGWNIYRDIILKAKLKVTCMVGFVIHPTLKTPMDKVFISVTNFGPGKIRCSMIFLRDTSLWKKITKKTKLAILIHDYEDHFSGQLPCELDVGDGRDFLFEFNKDCFLSEQWTHVGIKDSFSRIHWASKSNVKTARQLYKNKFGNKKS
jgi:hypothetical protein